MVEEDIGGVETIFRQEPMFIGSRVCESINNIDQEDWTVSQQGKDNSRDKNLCRCK